MSGDNMIFIIPNSMGLVEFWIHKVIIMSNCSKLVSALSAGIAAGDPMIGYLMGMPEESTSKPPEKKRKISVKKAS